MVATAPGETRTVELSDGSIVRMAGDSRLSYGHPSWFAYPDRHAEFEGSGFFDIALDDRGFVVKTPQAQVVVLGTSFSVQADHDRAEVVLAEGQLMLSARRAPDRSVVLEPGQMSRVGSDDVPSEPVAVALHERLMWTGLFVFHAVPLREMLPTLSSHYGAEVTADPSLLDERITGQFEQVDALSEVLEVVALAVDARVEASHGGLHVAPR